MEVIVTTLIPGPETREGVEHVQLAAGIAALHSQCFAWALVCCDNRREDAEDVLQEVYASVLDDGLRFDGRSTLKTWIFGVIRSKALGQRRRERLRALLGIRHAHRIDVPTAPSADDEAIATERRERTRAALGDLSRRQREVLLLVFYHDLSIEEAARIMGCSLGSARVHYARGKRRLAELLDGDRA